MKTKGSYFDGLFIGITALAAAVFALLTVIIYDGKRLAAAEAIVFGIILIYGIIRIVVNKKNFRNILQSAAKSLDYTDSKALTSLPFPVAVCDDCGKIIWSNSSFIENIFEEDISQTSNIRSIIGDADIKKHSVGIKCNDKYYSVMTLNFYTNGREYTDYCFIDNTRLKTVEEKYNRSIPYVVIIETDNIDENDEIHRDSEKAEIKSDIESMLDAWADKNNSVLKRISDDRFIIVTEKSNINLMTDGKFSIIDEVRNYKYKDRPVNITLSIGAAFGDSILSAEKEARKALDISLDRGGDQVTLKDKNDYIFFGGVSKSAERKYKVKSRIWSSQIINELTECKNVIVMGHTRSDFDSVGSAFAMTFACRNLGKEAYLVINESNTLSQPLVKDIKASEYADYLATEDKIKEIFNIDTLLILCDSHKSTIADYPVLFNRAEHKIIIDHHRLDPAADVSRALFLHNPGASSTCEMVSELLQYMIPDVKLPPVLAGAILSGIMLDTKNFIVNSGVRTFEAAAYLRKCGADTIKIKKYFENSLESNKLKNKVLINAQIYNNCAIAYVDESTVNPRIIASQAADELLNSNNVLASFVIYKENGRICISSRSMGEINVQLIMEEMGGGGHQTMAACQLDTVDINSAKQMLLAEIDKIKE